MGRSLPPPTPTAHQFSFIMAKPLIVVSEISMRRPGCEDTAHAHSIEVPTYSAYPVYSLLQNQLPAARKISPRGAGLQASVHGHFRSENSSSPLHITYLQALKSFFDPHIIEISSFLLLY